MSLIYRFCFPLSLAAKILGITQYFILYTQVFFVFFFVKGNISFFLTIKRALLESYKKFHRIFTSLEKMFVFVAVNQAACE